MKIFICLLSIVCLVKGGPLSIVGNSNNEIQNAPTPRFMESVIEELLESVRDMILNGSEDLPVLDPFVVDHLHLDDETVPLPGAHLTINDGIVRNLGTFVIDHLRTTTAIVITTIEVRGHIPIIEIQADEYDLFVPAMGYTVYGTGDLVIKIIRPSVDVTIRYGVITGMSTVLTIDIEDFQPQINGIFNDAGASNFVNIFLRYLVLDLLEIYEDDINDFLSEIVNDILSDVLPDFLPFQGFLKKLTANTVNIKY